MGEHSRVLHHVGKLGQQNRTVKHKVLKMQYSAEIRCIRRLKVQICQRNHNISAHFLPQPL
jgi:hypothetical protein